MKKSVTVPVEERACTMASQRFPVRTRREISEWEYVGGTSSMTAKSVMNNWPRGCPDLHKGLLRNLIHFELRSVGGIESSKIPGAGVEPVRVVQRVIVMHQFSLGLIIRTPVRGVHFSRLMVYRGEYRYQWAATQLCVLGGM